MSFFDRFRKVKKEKIMPIALFPNKVSSIKGNKVIFEPLTDLSEEEKKRFESYKMWLMERRLNFFNSLPKGSKTHHEFIFGFWCRDCKKVPEKIEKCFKKKHTILQAVLGEEIRYNKK